MHSIGTHMILLVPMVAYLMDYSGTQWILLVPIGYIIPYIILVLMDYNVILNFNVSTAMLYIPLPITSTPNLPPFP